jgi:hypothetical protein
MASAAKFAIFAALSQWMRVDVITRRTMERTDSLPVGCKNVT